MIQVAAAVIIENDQVFLSSRPADKPPAGWEFPGGKIESGESVFDALKRELMEEWAWQIEPVETLYILHRPELTIHFVRARRIDNTPPVPCEKQNFQWVKISGSPPEKLLDNDVEFWNFLTSM